MTRIRQQPATPTASPRPDVQTPSTPYVTRATSTSRTTRPWRITLALTLAATVLAVAVTPTHAQANKGDTPKPDAKADHADRPDRPGDAKVRLDGKPVLKPDARRDDKSDEKPDAAPEPLTDQQIDQGLDALRGVAPAFANKLSELRERNPDQFRRLLTKTPGIANRIREAAVESHRDPEGYRYRAIEAQLRNAAWGKTKQMLTAPPDQTDELKSQVQRLGEQAFDTSIDRRRHELTKIEKRIDMLRRQLADHREMRDQIVDDLAKEVIGGNVDRVMPVYLDPPKDLLRHDGDAPADRPHPGPNAGRDDKQPRPADRADNHPGKDHADNDRPDRPNAGKGELDDAQIDKMLDYIRQKDPELADRLADLRKNNPMMFHRTLSRIRQKVMPRIAQREDDPEAGRIMANAQQLQHKISKQADRLQHAGKDEKQREEIDTKLRKLLADIVELRFDLREHEIAQIEQRLENLRGEITEQVNNRDKIVAQRLYDLRQHVAKVLEDNKKHDAERDGKAESKAGDGDDPQDATADVKPADKPQK
ncbi:MAG: hypothetical protein GC159_11005 [Phycisphaera sp.]|nr:hypothetical protein [Phycisphaera sp.]